MTSQVLYRKWRPQRLAEVVGQQPVTQTLRYALATGRVAHAYLFCGPRGTGKTSTARILAKAINCLDLQEGEPCGRCPLCRDVEEGEALDIIEMDAASNRGIEEIRSLRERVHYSPTHGKHKTYIIDEVHMLTEYAFNALLKTLEEPPPHVILVLATTDPQKVPPTVISRCQRFDFRRISPGDAAQRLAQICQAEGVVVEEGALELIARSAWGSLRDATNILEQLIVSYGSPLQASHVRELLGMGDDESALQVAAFAMQGDVSRGLAALNAAASQGVDMRRFHRAMVEYLRAVLLAKSNPAIPLDYPTPIAEQVSHLASSYSLSRIYQVLKSVAQVNLRQESAAPLNLELALVECALAQESAAPPGQTTRPERPGAPPPNPPPPGAPRGATGESQEEAPPEQPLPVQRQPSAAQRETTGPQEASPRPQGLEQASPSLPLMGQHGGMPVSQEQWARLLQSLKKQRGKRFGLDGLLRSSKSQAVEGNCLTLGYTAKSHVERLEQEMGDPTVRHRIAQAVQQALGAPLEVRPVLLQQGGSPPEGHLVRMAQRFGGRVIGEADIPHTGEEA